jgi:thymidylate kinase
MANQVNYMENISIDQKPVLGIVRALCENLFKNNINYCHWKSNAALDRSASGDNDLDLLVDRSDSRAFCEVLYRLGFKEFLAPIDIEVPGIRDFFGMDTTTNNIVHVHAHFQLVIGHDLSKNYHLPVEREYLASARQGDLFRVPAPEYELMIFVLRMFIKHFSWDAIITNQGNISKNERSELEYLTNIVDLSAVHQILRSTFPLIDQNLFTNCLKVLQSRSSVWYKFKIGWKLQNQLQTFSRRSVLSDVIIKLWHRFKTSLLWHFFKIRFFKRSANGGFMVAIIGGDGAGKTTVLDGLYKWLSPHFNISCFHMGKPKWSWSTIMLRGFLKFGRILGVTKFSDDGYTYAPYEKGTKDYAQAIRALCTANDRFLTFSTARRFASNGGIALCDRFPIFQYIPMDGPQIQRMLVNNPDDWFLRWLHRKEQKLYQQITLPETLIVLLLDPEIAVSRKVSEQSDYVKARSLLVWQSDWTKTPAVVIDAFKSKEELLAEIEGLIWSKM